jgi:uncharacterized protein with PQ loop repeat
LSAFAGFLTSLAATLVFLGCAVATGLAAKRKKHIACVAGAVAMLATTIHFALRLGQIYDLKAAGAITPIHLTLARVTTACYLLPIATGVRTIFVPTTRRLHRKLAFLVLSMTVLTAITGTIMLLNAPLVAGGPPTSR